jgi:hypothetical protein
MVKACLIGRSQLPFSCPWPDDRMIPSGDFPSSASPHLGALPRPFLTCSLNLHHHPSTDNIAPRHTTFQFPRCRDPYLMSPRRHWLLPIYNAMNRPRSHFCSALLTEVFELSHAMTTDPLYSYSWSFYSAHVLPWPVNTHWKFNSNYNPTCFSLTPRIESRFRSRINPQSCTPTLRSCTLSPTWYVQFYTNIIQSIFSLSSYPIFIITLSPNRETPLSYHQTPYHSI